MINEEMEGELINFLVLPVLCPSVLCCGVAVKRFAQGGSESCKGLVALLPPGPGAVVAPAAEGSQDHVRDDLQLQRLLIFGQIS